MISPAQKHFEKVRAAREAAAAEAREKALEEARAREEAQAKSRAAQKPNPFEGQPRNKPAPSPARKHFERTRAKTESAQATQDRPHGDSYDLHQVALMEDIRRLADLQSIQRKIEAKRDLLPNYEDYVAGVLEGGSGQQDDVLMTVMVWYLDTGNLARGLDIAEYARRHGLETSDRYQRKTASLVSEEVADYVLKDKSEDEPAEEYLEQVNRALELFAEADMHDQIKAKLYKAQGYLLRESDRPAEALEALEQALQLDERAGVKKDIDALKRQLKNSGQ